MADPRFEAERVKAPHGAVVFEIYWRDGTVHQIPHRILRGYCPCATCQGHGAGLRFIASDKLKIKELAPVGNYALQFTFEDGHTGGIYSFRHLRRLGELYLECGDTLPEQRPEIGR